jgi:type I restriction enzyme S subunit
LTEQLETDTPVSNSLNSYVPKMKIELVCIPQNWKYCKFDDVLINRDAERIPISASNRKKTAKIYDYYGASGVIDKVEQYLFDCDLLLIGEDGANLLSRSTPIAFIARGRYWVNNHAHVLAASEYIMLEYAELVINSMSLVPFVTGAAQPKLSQNMMNKIPIPIPPIEEQGRIVESVSKAFGVLDKVDELQSRYISDRETLKSKLIDAGIQGKLTERLSEDGDVEVLYERLKEEKKTILKNRKGREDKNIKGVEDDIPYELHQNWKWVRLGEVGLFKKGPFGSALTKSMFIPKSEEAVKVYEQQHAIRKDASLGTYYISRQYFDEKMSGFEVESGDIIISCAGTIGETYILPEEIEQGIINQALMRVVLVDSVDKEFFRYYFDANLKKMAQNESNGSAIKNIPPFDVMKNWYFPLTSLEEQRRIVEKLNQLLNIV